MEVLGSIAIECRVIVLANGIEALDFLLQQGNYQNAANSDRRIDDSGERGGYLEYLCATR